MSKEKIHLVGGGLVGSLAAIYLAQRGYRVALFERRPDMRKEKVGGGRSINLALTARGLKALGEVGLREEALSIAIPMRGRMLHDVKGNTSFVSYGQRPDEVINSISRGELNTLLLRKAGSYENVEMFFNQRCADYDIGAGVLEFVDEETQKSERVTASRVIATDGSGSAIRKAIGEYRSGFTCSEEKLDYGYKELTIPATATGDYAMEKHALHIWPRKNFMLIALPNFDGSFTVTLFLAFAGEPSFESLKSKSDVDAFFAREFPDAQALMPNLSRQFFDNPTGAMVTVKSYPWHVEDKAVMLGDAAHAIVPFFGQGMNLGFEDCSLLGELLGKENDWQALFSTLGAARKPNADAIADMALENFVEMRDTVADAKFQLKKQIGFELERRYPGRFIPKYAMVVFHPEIPYAEARRLGKIQDTLLTELADGISSLHEVDWNKAAQLMGKMAGA